MQRQNRSLFKQLKQLEKNQYSEFSVELHYEDMYHLKAYLVGPKDTPYQGGTFHLNMEFPIDYPFGAPKCTFITRILHPNIGPNGHIDVDILKWNWCPALTIEKILISLISFMNDPNPSLDCALVPELGQLYMTNRTLYNEKVRYQTDKYAK